MSTVLGSTAQATAGAVDLLAATRARRPSTRPLAGRAAASPPRRCAPRRRPRGPRASSAEVSAAGPPRTNAVWPAAPPSFPAESASRTRAVPGRPRPHRGEQRAAGGERAAHGVVTLNHSPTKSATAIGSDPGELAGRAGAEAPVGAGEPQAGLPRRRARPCRAAAGWTSARSATNRGQLAHVGVEARVGVGVRRARRRASSSAVRAASAQNVSAGAVLAQRDHAHVRAHQLEAVALAGRAPSITAGRSRPTVCNTSSDAAERARAARGRRRGGRPGPGRPRRRGRCGRRRRRSRHSRSRRPSAPRSRRSSSAAIRPGAPIRPPPGCARRSAHPQAVDRRAEARPAGHRPVEEELLERQLALEDVALGEADPLARCRAASAPAGRRSGRGCSAPARRWCRSRCRRTRRGRASSHSSPSARW